MIAVEEHTGVAVVSLARPPVNALNLPMIEELESTFRAPCQRDAANWCRSDRCRQHI